jgi:pimeloyl-ACP methyl ester carboxylesterase
MTSVITGFFLPSWRFAGYTTKEKLNLWRGRLFTRRFGLWDQMAATDLTKQVKRLELPAYFMHGLHDWTVNYTLTKSYVERLDAPTKGFYTFENSAHSPVFEEPNQTRRILRQDILTGTTLLADPAPTQERPMSDGVLHLANGSSSRRYRPHWMGT